MPAAAFRPGEGTYRRKILALDVPGLAGSFGDALWCQDFTHRKDNPPQIAVVAKEDELAIVQQFTKAAAKGYLTTVVSPMSARDHALLRQVMKEPLWYSDRGNIRVRSAEVLRLHDKAFQVLLKRGEESEKLLPKAKYRRLTFAELASSVTQTKADIIVELSAYDPELDLLKIKQQLDSHAHFADLYGGSKHATVAGHLFIEFLKGEIEDETSAAFPIEDLYAHAEDTIRKNPACCIVDINFQNEDTRSLKSGRFLRDNGFDLVAE